MSDAIKCFIGFIGFGLLKKTTLIKHTSIEILLENGVYEPSNILIDANKEYELLVTRKDQTPCAECLMIPALNMSETLKLNKTVRVRPQITLANINSYI